MADRSLRLPRFPALTGLGARPGTGSDGGRRLPSVPRRLPRLSLRPDNVPLLIWRIMWLPFWFGSDVPAPALPARNIAVPGASGLAGQQIVRMLDSIRRRVWTLWALTIIVRAAWLSALVGCGWLLLERADGPTFRAEPLYWLAGITLVAGIIFAAVNRPTRSQTARMLDRSFRLHERISTALGNLGREVPVPGERAQVTYLQVADAANVITELRRHPTFRLRPPLRELVLALTCALVLAGLFFLRGIGGDIPDLSAANVPAFAPASTRVKPPEANGNPGAAPGEAGEGPTSEEVQARAQRSNEAQRDLGALGQALDDHAVTREAAEAIAQGDYDAAAEELRDAANDATGMSQESREALANDLDQAADQMSPGSSELSDATRTAADGLREGGEPAQQGVNDLGDAVQETGGDVASQQELRDQMSQAQENGSSTDQAGQEGQQESQSGDQSGEQSGEPGEAGAGEQAAGDPRQGEGGEGQQPGASEGQPGDPGSEGADAAPAESGGQQQSADRGSNPGGARDPGRGEQRGRDRPSSAPGSPGEGQPGSEASEGSPGGEQSAAPSETGASSDSAQQGDGAGSGEGDGQQAQETQGGESAGQEAGGQEGLPAEEQVTESQPPPPGEELPEPEMGETTIDLDDTGGGGIQTSTNAGSASAGSGTGVMTASGTTTQQEVGDAGPDSNRVPADKRDVVEDYFSDPGSGQ